jgi:beta-lactamase regulating signal transducer with metallopeptidase domain
MMPLIDPWLPSLVEASLKGTLILAAALAAARLMRRTSAEARHAVLAIGLSAFLFLPAATLMAPAWTVTIPEIPLAFDVGLPGSDAVDVAEARPSPAGLAATAGPASTAAPPATPAFARGATPTELRHPIDWSRTFLFVWLAGASLIALRLVVGVGRLWVLAGRSTMVTDAAWLHAAHTTAHQLGLTRGVTLLRGDGAAAPMTWGVLRPVVWVPQSASDWPDELRDAVLSHELAHVKRRDSLTQWLANIAVAVHWFNPVVWMAARALRVERERACDDAVLSLGTAAEEYAGQLLEMVRELGTMSSGPAPALAMARRSQLEGRLVAILDRAVERGPVPSTRVLAVATFALVFVAVLAGAQVSRDAVLMAAENDGVFEAIATVTESAHVEARAAVETKRRVAAAFAPASRDPLPERRKLDFATPPELARAPELSWPLITEGEDHQRLLEWIVGPDRARISAPPVARLAVPSVKRRAPIGSVGRGSGRQSAPLLAQVQAARADTALLLEIIAAADGISSSSERFAVLDRVANLPSLDSNVVNALARSAGRTSGSTSKAKLLKTMIQKQPHARGASRRAVLDAIAKLSSSPQDQAALLTLFLTEGTLDDSALVDGLHTVERITSSSSKAQVLVSTARARKIEGPAQDAYVKVAKSISGGNDRARALTALLGDPGGPSR